MRTADAIRLAVAVPALVSSRLVARAAGALPNDGVVAVTRVLALRYACQAALGAVIEARCSPTSRARFLAADAAVEGCHAASMLPAAALFPTSRRAAAASAALAAGLAMADLESRSRLDARPAHRLRWRSGSSVRGR